MQSASSKEVRITANAEPDASIEDCHVGQQIRELRRVKRLRLHQLADAVGVSVGYLSQIERNRSKLSVATLRKICEVLGVHISWFFQPATDGARLERDFVVRAKNRRSMAVADSGINEELLSPNLSGPLELLMSTMDPGADSGTNSHDGTEAGVVIAGVLDLWVNDLYFQLDAGDSFSFCSKERHRFRNPGATQTKVVWVITPPYY